MPLEEEFVDVAALGCVHGVEAEVIEQEQVDPEEAADLGVERVIEATRHRGRVSQQSDPSAGQ